MFRGEGGSRGAEVTEAKPDIASMPFEAALAELEAIVDQLEEGQSRSMNRSGSTNAAKP